MSTPLRVNRLHFPVTVLGPGRRVGVWFQGCSLGCAGCLSRDTWDAAGGRPSTVDSVVEAVIALVDRGGLDGVTVSGGEPFEQPGALLELVRRLRVELAPLAPRDGIDVLCYSGLRESDLRRRFPHVLAELDLLVPEPYVARSAPGGRWRGSDNQQLVTLSDLGRSRLAAAPADLAEPSRPELQVAVDDHDVWIVGIPRPGDLARLEAALAERGVRIGQASWRP